jgi:hypothetical protein
MSAGRDRSTTQGYERHVMEAGTEAWYGSRDGKVHTGAQTETRALRSTVGQVPIQTEEVQAEGSNRITMTRHLD